MFNQTRIACVLSLCLSLFHLCPPAAADSEELLYLYPPSPVIDPYNRPPDKYEIRRYIDPFKDPRIAPYVDPLARYCDRDDTLYSLPDVEVLNPNTPYWFPDPDLEVRSGVICYQYKVNCVDVRGGRWTEFKLICFEIQATAP